jgi:hypothetical protein
MSIALTTRDMMKALHLVQPSPPSLSMGSLAAALYLLTFVPQESTQLERISCRLIDEFEAFGTKESTGS